MDGFVADILRGRSLIEIQTANFSGLGAKLDALLDGYDVTVVHPISVRTRLYRSDGVSRVSPVKRSVYNVVDELVRIPTMLDHPRFTLHVFLIEENQMRERDPSLRRGRGGWSVVGRSLERICEERVFTSGDDLAELLPERLADRFTTADIASEAGVGRAVAQRLAYCLRLLGQVEELSRTRAGVTYTRLGRRGERGVVQR